MRRNAARRGSVRGFWDAKARAFLESRVFGDEARGPVYEEAANAFRTHADDAGWWQGEYWGKTMLSAVAAQPLAPDPPAFARWAVGRALAFVAEFQRPDGYIGTYSDPRDVGPNPDGSEKFNWNLWSRKYTLWALVGVSDLARREGDGAAADALLAAASRLARQIVAQFAAPGAPPIGRTGFFAGIPSTSLLKPLLLLHRRTGDPALRAFAAGIVADWERPDGLPGFVANAFSDAPVHAWHPNPAHWAKAYESMSCLEGLLDWADLADDARLVEAVSRIADKLAAAEGTPLGSVGFFDHFTHATDCPNCTTELCDAIHWMRLCRDLFLATGEAKHLDRLERAFLGAFLSGLLRGGRWAAHAVRSHGARHVPCPHQVGMERHQCCVDNAPRAFETLAGAAAALDADGTLRVGLLFEGESSLPDADGDEVSLRLSPGYPFGGRAALAVRSARPRRVLVRAPAGFAEVRADGAPPGPDGWIELRHPGGGERAFALAFEPAARLRAWRPGEGADPRAALFEMTDYTPEAAGSARTRGAAWLSFGPMVLAKSTLAGATRDEVFATEPDLDETWSVSLEPRPAERTAFAWRATFSKGPRAFSVPVCDLASCDADDPGGAFSIWF